MNCALVSLKFSEVEHIGRNPRFDREQHWAEIEDILQTLGKHVR